ncbi:F0F1 ATP synthase subunit B family protein [Nocardia altamirensis]|uniref:F0F1 ATP synthase subunit B family protein n=1 Tax=Nocardia altamirensis TaxID=472158 RepID=UPI0008400387|nr:hypothetical protein [Nocardia altamirensis]
MSHIVLDWPIFLSQLFGFAVLVYALTKWVTPRVGAAMRKTQHNIRKELEESKRAATQVVAAEEAHEAALAQAALAATQFADEAHTAAAGILEDAAAAAEELALRTKRHGHERISRARREAVDELRAGLHAAVLERTEHTVRQRLTSAHAKSQGVDRILDELEVMA